MTPIMLSICARDLMDESLISSLESHKFTLMSRRGVHDVDVVETNKFKDSLDKSNPTITLEFDEKGLLHERNCCPGVTNSLSG